MHGHERLEVKNTIAIPVIIFCFFACAQTPHKIWKSTPSLQAIQNDYYEARLEPLKKGNSFFTWFLLTIKNNTGENLEIDWNKSRYIYNNRAREGFTFRGIVPEDIKNLAIPPDVIPAGKTFSREIAPMKLIAFAPFRDSSIEENESGITPGIIPAGENGIFLVVRYNGKEVKKKITVTIESAEMPR